MKKYILLIILITIITPSVTFAAWWNPFSWGLKNMLINIFGVKKEQVQIIEKEQRETEGEKEGGGDFLKKEPDNSQKILDPEKIKKPESQLNANKIEDSLLRDKKSLETEDTSNKKETELIELLGPSEKEDIEEDQALPLDIKDLKIKVKNNTATITWETNYPTESILVIIGTVDKFYTSEKGLNDKHLVRIYELEKDQEYNFKIKATTEDKSQTDTHFQSFFAIEEIQAHLGEYEEGKYQKIIIIDSEGRLKNKEVGIGLYKKTGDVLYSYGRVYLETSSYGEIEFKDKKLVDKVNRFIISYLDYDDVIIDRE